MMQECSMRDKIKPGVYAILSAVALCISGRFSVIIGGWAKLAAELSGEKEQAFVIVILLMILYRKSWSIYIRTEMDNTYISSVFFLLYAYRKKFFSDGKHKIYFWRYKTILYCCNSLFWILYII